MRKLPYCSPPRSPLLRTPFFLSLPLPSQHFSSSSFPQTSASNLPAFFARALDRSSLSSWNAAISDLARSDEPATALAAFSSLRRLGLLPDRSTLPPALRSAGALSALLPGCQLHLLALRLGFLLDPFVASSLVHMYSLCRAPCHARRAFDETPQRNPVIWTAMISGYVLNNYPNEAFILFRDLLTEEGGDSIDSPAAVSALAACSRILDWRRPQGLHGLVVKVGLDSKVGVANTLVDAYAKGAGNIVIARKVFDEMPEKDVISWNSIIALYAQNGLSTEALDLYSMMQNEEKMQCNAVTLSAALLACAHAGALQTGKCIHDQVVRMGLEENIYVGTSVVDMYGKCGKVTMARKAFDRMREKNILSWSAMIAGYGMHGQGQQALQLFDQLLCSGGRPNYITFVSVLAACSHAGLLPEGRYWFNAMKKEYDIDPGVEHYGCIVDLLGRAGYLDEAYGLIKEMKIKPDFVVWGALLSACRVHKNVELGEISAKKLFELYPKNCGYYILLSNLYADAGRWEDVERVRDLIKKRGIVKPPGYSLVDLKGKIHMFLVGDMRHPQHKHIYDYLEKLCVRLQEAGYVPDKKLALHDVDEEEKETVLRVHSEKLAVAFALINTVPGTPITVIKNLRVCGDCHSAMKLIAKLVGREIVVRDSHRFHHFKDGLCSCCDYW